ncbi:tonB-system energizer ExbB [Klebsiella pneumoniae]|uniref:tonB-system energizer ExbB n=1 Tax=Klebsiella TaxID=570 RepID=UPI0007CC5F10|nr:MULTISPECIES: tonB-system energizer ExbB [Klebsiella]MCH9373872.1 tonB-system energizer ExbB [Klebsiella pneumoniae]MCH9480993.1 tonB-system energizer ExbB [Klebsiella pneumoniae]MDR4829891.1 tonB-system energizer ExbB [Klebsiella pneumoniae]SAU20919.1 MotA/TolQ/ExbB proton channel family protein [Klebsiella pneumoniae]
MHIYSKKTDGLSGTAKIRFGFSVALLLLMTVSTGVWAEPQTTNADAVSATAVGTPQTGAALPKTSSANAPGTASVTGTAASTPAAARPPVIQDFSPIALYHHADRIVKAVILILIFASVLSWSIWSGKTLELLVRGRRMRKNLAQLVGKHSLYQCGELSTPSCEQMRQVALGELNHVQGRLTSQAVQALRDRVLARIQRVEAAEARRATRGASILATTSAVAPFIGLFGTVWGIMHSFISIAQSQTTNLSVVAPGIAEALFATALGLVVAIPAVILYNVIGRLITGYRLILAEAMTLTLCLLSHDLDVLEQDAHTILTSAA